MTGGTELLNAPPIILRNGDEHAYVPRGRIGHRRDVRGDKPLVAWRTPEEAEQTSDFCLW